MKNSTVCSFLLSLFVVFVIASCDSSTGVDDSGQRIGTFMVYPDQMDWVGTQGSSKSKFKTTTINAEGDTLILDQPEGKNLYMTYNGEFFPITYEDSSYSNTTDTIPTIYLDNPVATNYSEALSYGQREDHIAYNSVAYVDCDSSYTGSEDFVLRYHVDPDTSSKLIKTVILNTQGIVDAAKTLKGCNQAP